MPCQLIGPFNTGVAAGGAGAAAANVDIPVVTGEIVGVYVKYNDAPPATTDVVLKTKGLNSYPPTYNILALTDANTSGWFFPSMQRHTTAGALIAGEYTGVLVADFLNLAIAQANDGDSADVWLLVR